MTDSSLVPASSADNRLGSMLASARQGDPQRLGQLLECYRSYLTIIASAQLDTRLQKRISPSDLVQETMLGACRDFHQFRGRTEPELLAWLRQILINCLRHMHKMHLRAKRRDLRREISLDQMARDWSGSIDVLASILTDSGSTPSNALGREERALVVANQLSGLSADYRDVIVLRNFQGLAFSEVARKMGRSPGAVRMLWLRALDALRKRYLADEEARRRQN